MTKFTFKENLYFNRKDNLLTFNKSQGKILVCKSGVSVTFPDLLSFMERYTQVDRNEPQQYFTDPVKDALIQLNILEAPPQAEDEADTAATGDEQSPAEETRTKTVPSTPKKPPSEKIQNISSNINKKIIGKISEFGAQAILDGQLDDDIHDIVEEMSRELKPRQVLKQLSNENDEEQNRLIQNTLASQAFGNEFNLTEKELFLIAKSALLYGLKEQDRQNLPVIKQNLLSAKPSLSLTKRLKHFYHEITNWLRRQKVDADIAHAIDKSQFIYYEESAGSLNMHATILGITDGYLTLKNIGKKLLSIETILSKRLSMIGQDIPHCIPNLQKLIHDSCYNEYRVSHLKEFSGGDHCEFKRLDANHYGLMIFDVSGHDETASSIRDNLVEYIGTLNNQPNPANLAVTLNNYLMNGHCPDDRFVSFLYGVIDIENDTFIYSNAGHNPPYMVQKGNILTVKENDLLLNISPYQYSNHKLNLRQGDSLVFYTDGLTEARKTDKGELFGTNRLEKTLAEKNVDSMKAKKAVNAILNVIEDEGFTIEDDITIQVYRHI